MKRHFIPASSLFVLTLLLAVAPLAIPGMFAPFVESTVLAPHPAPAAAYENGCLRATGHAIRPNIAFEDAANISTLSTTVERVNLPARAAATRTQALVFVLRI